MSMASDKKTYLPISRPRGFVAPPMPLGHTEPDVRVRVRRRVVQIQIQHARIRAIVPVAAANERARPSDSITIISIYYGE